MKSNKMKGNISTYIIIGVIILIIAIILWVVITKLSEHISVKHHTGKSAKMTVETWYEIIGDTTTSANTVPLFKYVKIISDQLSSIKIDELSKISIDKNKFNVGNSVRVDDLTNNPGNIYNNINEADIKKTTGLYDVCENTMSVIIAPSSTGDPTKTKIYNNIDSFLSQVRFSSSSDPIIGWWGWSNIKNTPNTTCGSN
tara:strand:+ start:40 stop:636 length:597 start_codon:yes stop_codon:yes gene_type:complete